MIGKQFISPVPKERLGLCSLFFPQLVQRRLQLSAQKPGLPVSHHCMSTFTECSSEKRILWHMYERYDTDTVHSHIASRFGNDEVVALLLRSGAKVTAVDSEGHTALHFAAVNGHIQCAKVLLGAGIDPFVKGGGRVEELAEGAAAKASIAASRTEDANAPATAQEMAHDSGHVAMDRMLYVASERS